MYCTGWTLHHYYAYLTQPVANWEGQTWNSISEEVHYCQCSTYIDHSEPKASHCFHFRVSYEATTLTYLLREKDTKFPTESQIQHTITSVPPRNRIHLSAQSLLVNNSNV